MVGSLVNNELEWILKERIMNQFKVNTWRDQERQRKLVKTARQNWRPGLRNIEQKRCRLDRAVSMCLSWTTRYHDMDGEERLPGTRQRQRQFRILAPMKVGPPWWYY